MLRQRNLNIEPLRNSKEAPFDILVLADPSRPQIESYLKTGMCYIAKLESRIIGVVVLNPIDISTIEIKNVAVKESEQGKGYGKALLRFSEKMSIELGYKTLVIGTGNSSIGQLVLYQKEGFNIVGIEKNFFLDNYSETIFENGIQCRHMIILEKELNKNALQQCV